MFEGKYILADMCIGIRSLYDEVQRMCEDYRAPMDSTPEFIVETTEQDIEAERIQSEETRIEEGLPPYAFDAAYLETLAVYRQIATECVLRGRLLMHGSVVAVDGRAYMFTAKSGTGKSTHVRLWRKLFGERAVMVNDDKPLLRIRRVSGDDLPADEESVLVYGTPWDGKHRLSTNMSAPLEAICILTRAKENTIREIKPSEALAMLLQQTFRPEDPTLLLATFDLLDQLSKHVRFYLLGCNMDPEAAVVSSNAMLPRE